MTEYSDNLTTLKHSAFAGFLPPPKMTISQWADSKRKLSSEASAMPGQWHTSMVEYMREPMDCIGDIRIASVVIMAGAQVAKSEVLLNAMGFLIDHDPCPMLMVQPTVDLAEAFSKDRIATMLRDTPALAAKVEEAKSRDSSNTIRQKMFPGGHLTLVGANAPAGLASRPIRAVFFDEVDRFPVSAGTEGDPITLAKKRTTTFWNRINVEVSTPTNKGSSRIEASYEEGDQRQRWCKCVDCGEMQILKWGNIRWQDKLPQTAHYVCEHCGSIWNDVKRVTAVKSGEWRAQVPFTGIASFHVPSLLSTFATMADGVREFLSAQGDPSKMKVWVNTYLGETWEEDGVRIDSHSLSERAEEYESTIPDGVTLLTAGADVQDDRIEVEIVGWGDWQESWSIEYRVLYGDPSSPALWTELKEMLRQIYDHPRFGQISIRAACIDTGGHYTAQVYKFVSENERIYGIKGMPGVGKPLVGRPSLNNYGKIPLFPVGTHTAKETVYARLKAKPASFGGFDDADKVREVGYCHFPVGRTLEYYEQLTAEKLVTRYSKGVKRVEFVKTRKRNEALDNRVYATAALELLAVDLVAQRKAQEARLNRERAEAERAVAEAGIKKPKKASTFVDSWRDFNG